MYRIGLTGNIATGKTLVLKRLAYHGAFCIDADRVAHEIMLRSQPAWAEIRAHFGESILDPEGEIDRAVLGRVVFNDPEKLRALEQIVHPRVIERVESLFAASQAPVGVVEAIKLIESGMADRCDALWVTTSSRCHQMQRLIRDRKLSRQEAQARIDAQPPPGHKVCRADVLLENEGSKAALLDMVDNEWQCIEQGTAPGQGPGPGQPYESSGTWFIAEGSFQAAACPAGTDRWRLVSTTTTRMPRLFRPLVAALEARTAQGGSQHLSLLVLRQTGYCQFMEGMGYVEAQGNGAEPGEALYSRDLG